MNTGSVKQLIRFVESISPMQLKKRLLSLAVLVAMLIINSLIFYFNGNKTPSSPGPCYVDGWYRNTSRNVRDYVSEDLKPHILPSHFCNRKFQLLVIVHSKTDNFQARQSIRESWGQRDRNFSLYFLIGEDGRHSNESQLRVNSESEIYNDIIQERFIDSYNNLSLKSVNMLKLFHLHCRDSYDYLMKVDDDIILLIDSFLDALGRYKRTDLLLGNLLNHTKPIRDPQSKWYVPSELYPDPDYPDYVCGAAYLMSKDVAEKLYYCSLDTPILFIEDAYITGICRQKINVPPLHNPNFTCYTPKKNICLQKYLYVVHQISPGEMKEYYNTLKENYCSALESFWEWLHSLF